MRVLVADDDALSRRLLEVILSRADHEVKTASDGAEALALLAEREYDAVLTDWLMPNIDGLELIRRIRVKVRPAPILIVQTDVTSERARSLVLRFGADGYLAKPLKRQSVLDLLSSLNDRRRQEAPNPSLVTRSRSAVRPPFVGVCIAASTGGPEALSSLVSNLPADLPAAIFLVQHSPDWVTQTLAAQLARHAAFPVRVAENGVRPEPGTLYLAPGGRHLEIKAQPLALELCDTPRENFVKPAADPLFKSVADVFGRFCVAVILTGMGSDGTAGAERISIEGGTVLVQDPATAVIDMGLGPGVGSPTELGAMIEGEIRRLSTKLDGKSATA